ncbi:RidA family protein [Nocardia uniformis]|uniref:RidA family protein n=1 Tax=Nocardia uniformis TaxID=53432 RepID=UPI000A9C6BC9|nr:RidA family protein [Nocardia uniformis]
MPAAIGGYTNGLEVLGAQRLLFVSGQIPEDSTGSVPTDPEAQCRIIWANILATLADAGMTAPNIVKVTTYLSDRAVAEVNTKVRAEILGDHRPALTVVLAGIFDPKWLLEIEVIAAD